MGHFCLKAESSTDSRFGRVSPDLLLPFVKFFALAKKATLPFSFMLILTLHLPFPLLFSGKVGKVAMDWGGFLQVGTCLVHLAHHRVACPVQPTT